MAEERSSGRRPRLLAASFAAGLAAGFLLGRIASEPPPAPPAVVLPQPRTDAGDPVVLGSLVTRSESFVPPPLKDANRADASESPIAGWVEVTVRDAEGRTEGIGGTVYALPAGDPGAKHRAAVPHAEYTPPGPARIPLPAAGSWDVGIRSGLLSALEPDVVVEPGTTAPVELTLPMAAPLRFDCPGWPPRKKGSTFTGKVAVVSRAGPVSKLPGRLETAGVFELLTLQADGTATTGPLPVAGTYAIRPYLEESPDRNRFEGDHWFLDADATAANGGGLVTLELVRNATMEVRMEPDGGAWPDGVSFSVEKEGESVWYSLSGSPLQGRSWRSLRTPPGRVTLRWHGPGVRGGSRELVLREGPNPTVAVPVAFRSARWPAEVPEESPEARVPVRFAHLPETASGRDSVALMVAAPGDSRWRIGDITTVDATVPRPAVEGEWRRVGTVLATCGTHLASDPVAVPATGPIEIPFRPGGILVVVSDRTYPPEIGALALRRADGLPILVRGEVVYREAPVQSGSLLGPFPEGTIRFEVILGRKEIGTASAVVAAGRNTSLLVGR